MRRKWLTLTLTLRPRSLSELITASVHVVEVSGDSVVVGGVRPDRDLYLVDRVASRQQIGGCRFMLRDVTHPRYFGGVSGTSA